MRKAILLSCCLLSACATGQMKVRQTDWHYENGVLTSISQTECKITGMVDGNSTLSAQISVNSICKENGGEGSPGFWTSVGTALGVLSSFLLKPVIGL